MSTIQILLLSSVKNIKLTRPFYYLDYNKKEAQELLKREYGWEYYGGHHHENVFTKFAISYWLPRKFNIDKRKITLSAQVLSGEISREQALEMLSKSPYDPDQMERDKDYVIKKLDMTNEEFNAIWDAPNKYFKDYPSYYPYIKKFAKYSKPFFKYILNWTPTMFFEMEERENSKKI
ncbi:MAG: hypothetical protein WCK67_13455 [bacterium]